MSIHDLSDRVKNIIATDIRILEAELDAVKGENDWLRARLAKAELELMVHKEVESW